ncbi:GUN4 domain-containing protein [Sphaerospermopsis sp. LEGE 00249]|nr:GUN4 domain-containing protein [Sphaerospermopsis sp. LEGE 00249]
MTNHSQQPGKYDAVLGSQHQTSEFAAVLGGIEGVKLGLSNPNPQVRIVSVKQALNYGESGLDLVIQALNDESIYVQNTAYTLLEPRTEEKVKEALIIFDNAQLKSDVGMDYRKLRDYLKAGNWKEADEETAWVMLAVAKREKEGWLDTKSIDNFSCADLRTIDQLWVKYSNGNFGFSVQKRIYQGLDGTREYNQEIWEKFGEKVGWRKGGRFLYYRDTTFDIKAPIGHLPHLLPCVYTLGWGSRKLLGWSGFGFFYLASRLVNCNI